MALNMKQVYDFAMSSREVFDLITKDVGFEKKDLDSAFSSKDFDQLITVDMDKWELGRDLMVKAYKASGQGGSSDNDEEKAPTIQTHFIVADSDDGESREVLRIFRYVSRQGLVRTQWYVDEMDKLDRVASVFSDAGRENVNVCQVTQRGDLYTGTLDSLACYMNHQVSLVAHVPVTPPKSAPKKES